MKKLTITALSLIIGLFIVNTSLSAQCGSNFERNAEKMAQELSQGFYFDKNNSRIFALSPGEAGAYAVQLYKGNKYLIVGVGDDDVNSLTMALMDENRHVIDGCVSTRLPACYVSVSPKWTGRFAIGVENSKAAAASCILVLTAYK